MNAIPEFARADACIASHVESVSQSIALTASNLDKIAHLADPFPESGGAEEGDSGDFSTSPQLQRWKENPKRQQAILAAAAGDAADSDRLLGYLKAIGSLEEYTHGGMGCDVVSVSLDGDTAFEPPSARSCGGLDARSMAHLARRCIWEKLRSRTPYRVCLLVAGMELDESRDETERIVVGEDEHGATTKPAFLSQRVQNQVKQASRSVGDSSGAGTKASTAKRNDNNVYKPSLFWLDEYGSLQAIEYGAHGHASNFLLSILDQNYRPDLTRTEALELMKECFRELRSRYVINSPEDPCIKCVDAHGVKVM